MTGLGIERVGKSFGDVPVLRDVSLRAGTGKFVVVVGPSGCGKTTLLRCLAGLEAVDEGQIRLGSLDITDKSPAERNVAMVFQNYALYPTKTVRQNMSFALRQRRTPRAEIERRVAAAAATLQIEHLMDRRPAKLSGGQRQRVAIGRAMVREPSLFLFDEPLSNLDAALRGDLRVEIKRIHKAMGVTSVYVTHDQHEAMSLADLLVVMKDGRIEQMGPPAEVYRSPLSRFVAGFIGSPAMQFISAQVTKDGVALPGGVHLQVPGARNLAEGTAVDVGARPDDLLLAQPEAAGHVLGRVDLVQELGATRLIRLLTDAGPLNVSQSADEPCPEGVTAVTFKHERILLFDRQSGRRIG